MPLAKASAEGVGSGHWQTESYDSSVKFGGSYGGSLSMPYKVILFIVHSEVYFLFK